MAGLIDGRRIVTTAGTPVALSTTAAGFRALTVTAETDNTGIVVVGGTTVVAALATRRGTPLAAGDTATIRYTDDGVNDMQNVWIDATVSGDGVTFTRGAPF